MSAHGSGGIAPDDHRRDVDLLLQAWGQWNRSDQLPSAFNPFGLGSTVSSAMISDELAGLVDAAVCTLREPHPLTHQAIKLYYISTRDIDQIRRRLRIKRSKVRILINAGIDLVAWQLDNPA